MGPLWRSCLLASLLWLAGAGQAQDLGERDALCRPGGCYAVYFQRKTFLDAWRSCRDRGGNLATVKRPEEAALIHELFSGLEPRAAARARARIWIGLQRQPRQCSATRPLRGFTWITGDQDTQYTHWLREDSPSTCAAPRCVVMTHSQDPRDRQDNLKWQDGSCTLPVDGYLCRYAYRGMCPPLESEGGGPVLYSTPFHLVSALLSHVPFGSVASVPCPEGTRGDQSALCLQREDGGTGWSREAPFCSDAPRDWCRRDNGGCQHLCRAADAHYYCECLEGYELGADGQSCGPADACRGDPCEFECHAAGGGFLCACPEGYLFGWAPELPGWPTDTPPLDWPTDTPPPEWPTDTPHPDLPTDTPLLDWPTDTPPLDWPTDTPHPDLPTDTPLLDWPTDTPPPHWPTDTPHPDLPTDTPLLDWPTDTPALDWPTDTPHPDRPTDTPPPHWPTDTPPLDWPTDTPALDWLTYQPGLVWVPPDFGWETDTPPEGLTTTHPENRGRPTSGRAAPPDPTPDRWRTGRIGEVPPSTPPAAASEHQGAPSPGTPGATAAAAGSGGRASPEDEEGGTSGWHSPPSPPSTAGPPGTPTPPAPGSEAPPGGTSRQRRDNSWLLVALLVPLSIFVVVMVALGIVYCTRCAVRPRSKSVADCYRWITSSAGKQGV
nr:PREDICTED: endosialin [Lepisosteus oculatus]